MQKLSLAFIVSRLLFLIVVLIPALSSLPPYYMKYLPVFRSFKPTFLHNPISVSERRFAQAKKMLERESNIGYVDETFGPLDYRDGKTTEPYYMAQYAFAPLAVEYGASNQQYVIGNFSKDFIYQDIAKDNGLRLVKDFNDGVVVFANTESGP